MAPQRGYFHILLDRRIPIHSYIQNVFCTPCSPFFVGIFLFHQRRVLAIFGVLVGFVFGKGSVFKVLKVFVYVCVTVASLITLDFNLFNSLMLTCIHHLSMFLVSLRQHLLEVRFSTSCTYLTVVIQYQLTDFERSLNCNTSALGRRNSTLFFFLN